jgi:Ca2+:H+ antiporter
MKKTSPNPAYTDRLRFWTRAHGGTSPHGHGGTGGTQPVNSHQPSTGDHHLTQSVSHPAGIETIDLEAQHHALHHSHGPGGSTNDIATPAASFTSAHDAELNQTASEAAPKGPVVNASQDIENNESKLESKPNLMVRFARTSKMILLHSKINLLLVFVPVGIAMSQVHTTPGIVFAMNAIAIIPLAGLLSHATESVARKFGDATGALLNVTFGNAVELIIL